MKYIVQALKKVYFRFSMIMVTGLSFVLFLVIDYFLLTRTTSISSFISDNSKVFVYFAVILSALNDLFISVVLTYLVYVIDERRSISKSSSSNSIIAVFLSLVSVGCAVCGGFLLPIVGIAASLTAFPFQGLEIKLFSIALLLLVLWDMSGRISGVISRRKKGKVLAYSYIVGVGLLVTVYLIPRLPFGVKSLFANVSQKQQVVTKTSAKTDEIFNEINPEKGYDLHVSYGNIGPEMIKSGVIDLAKFKQAYQQSGSPLTQSQIDILTKGSNKNIVIDRQNSYFLLNFFWAAGLANRTDILTQGDMTQYGQNQVGSFASTGGWTLAQGSPMDYYSQLGLIPLTAAQQTLVQKVSSNIYRPCCNNPTSFPDCNHGMALLGVLELMAKNNATENQMYEAAKYINAFWFPSNYYDIALYFKNKEGKSFTQVPGQDVLGKEVSSATGAQAVKQWLVDHGVEEKPPQQGSSCGV